MKDDSASYEDTREDELDTLLTHAPRYTPPAGFAERVIAALHEEEIRATTPQPHIWHLPPYFRRSVAAVAACLVAALCLLPWLADSPPQPTDSLALDDALLVDEVLDSIDDPDLISAICSVSTGAYSISTGAALSMGGSK